MVTLSQADAKRIRLEADTPSALTNLTDLEWNFYSPQSGLVPASKYSITDHKMAYYKLQGNYSGSIRDVETAFFKAQGAVGNSYDEIRYDFYANRQFFLPSALAGLELWLASDNISGAVLASDGFDRSKNLFAGSDPSFEGAGSWQSAAGVTTTTAFDATQFHSGTKSWKITNSSAGAGDGGTDNFPSRITALPNTIYTASVWVYSPVAQNLYLRISYRNANNINTIYDSPAASVGPNWTRLIYTSTSANDTSSMFIGVRGSNIPVGGSYYIDDYQVEIGSKPTAFVWGDATHLGTTDQGQLWTAQQGTLGVVSGKASPSASTTQQATINIGVPDFTVSIDIGGDYTGAPAILAKWVDANNYLYFIAQGDTNPVLYVRVAGVTTARGALGAGKLPGTPTTITLSISGTNISATVPGYGTINYTLSGAEQAALLTSTIAGIQTGNAVSPIDNFLVKTPIYSDGASLPVWADKSGYARHALQTTVGKQPKYRTSNPNLLTYNQATAEIDSTGWSSSTGNPTIGSTAVAPLQGSKSWTMTSTVAAQSHSHIPGSALGIPVVPGQTVSFSIVAQGVTAAISRQLGAGINFYDAGGGFVSSSFSANVNVTDSAPVTLTQTSVVPVGAAFAAPGPTMLATAIGDQYKFDMAGFYIGNLPASWLAPVNLPSTGKPAVQFDGLDDELAQVIGSLNTYTAFIVARIDGNVPAVNERYLGFSGGGGAHNILLGGAAAWQANAGAAFPSSGSASDPLVFGVIDSFYDGNNISVGVNGAIASAAAGAVVVGTSVFVGSIGTSAYAMGEIAAVLVFSRVLSTTERQQVESFLKNKYGTP